MGKKEEPEFMKLLADHAKVDALGNLKFSGLYASGCVNIGYKGGIVSVPHSHVVWFLTHGQWPKEGYQIDHVDDDSMNNSPDNLQELTHAENQEKRRGRIVSRAYGKGKYGHGFYIHNDKRDHRFYVSRTLSRGHHNETLKTVKKTLGGFDTIEEAESKIKEYIAEIEANGPDHLPAYDGPREKRRSIELMVQTQKIRRLRAEGKTYQQIADITGFSLATVYHKSKDVECQPTTTKLIPTLPNGSETSLLQDTSPQVMLTSEASLMCEPANSEAIVNAISSRESPDGRLPSVSPDGKMSVPSGLAHAPVSRYRSQENNSAMSMNDISGPLFIVSSPSADLQSSLENKLRARLAKNGLPPFVQTWKMMDMPAGLPLCRLSVSVLPIDGTGFGLLPTPSGTSNHGKNHVAGRLDEWGGSKNPFRGTNLGNVHCPAFELWVMGYPEAWAQLMPRGMPSSRKLPLTLSQPIKNADHE